MISIIVPVFNEAERISHLLQHLRKNSQGHVLEIIVVDGGITDETLYLLHKEMDVKILSSDKGRAKQMNTGARSAKGDILYFLHADSFPPLHFDRLILETSQRKGSQAGCFMLKFDADHWWLRLMGRLTAINHMCCRGGDQSLFVSRTLFWGLGGFNERFLIYEDNDLIGKLYGSTKFTVIKKRLVTSSRRYDKMGVWKLQWIYLSIYWKKRIGAGPEQLYAHYKRKIAL